MKYNKILLILLTAVSILFPISATVGNIRKSRKSLPTANIISDGTELKIQDGQRTQIIKASRLNLRVIDGLNCQARKIFPSQRLAGRRFLPQGFSFNPKTGNLAVGVVLQECFDIQQSAVFILEPQRSWRSYAIYRVQLPGRKALPDEFSSYPFRNIIKIGFFANDLLVKHGDASDSQGLLVFGNSGKPAGKYDGCVVTSVGENQNICPIVISD
ncbi:hypothetical protein [Mastigocoleus testarum]|uniref:Uncharacterized protein n=1 Tax=Mastigocoleus testarum BC008 TaxID=371196 RepID=A0A0V7ZTF7_9CYAN|nr:hypothetical protein [Mastigocoleus testarum]KST67650.1 hypothetical protein BC008_43610 [Mastigocoleus testarum BC008]